MQIDCRQQCGCLEWGGGSDDFLSGQLSGKGESLSVDADIYIINVNRLFFFFFFNYSGNYLFTQGLSESEHVFHI